MEHMHNKQNPLFCYRGGTRLLPAQCTSICIGDPTKAVRVQERNREFYELIETYAHSVSLN